MTPLLQNALIGLACAVCGWLAKVLHGWTMAKRRRPAHTRIAVKTKGPARYKHL